MIMINCLSQSSSPTLTKREMYADFDSLYNTIASVNPHDFVRKSVNKYAMLDSIKLLKKQIENIKTTEEFYWLINKALTFCQDDHTSVVSKRFYPFIDSLDKVRLKTTIADTAIISAYSKMRRNRRTSIRLDFPIKYIEGNYKVLQTFTIKGRTIKQGSTLTSYNQKSIPEYLNKHIGDIEAMHWDFERKQWYKDDFYKGNHIPLEEENLFNFLFGKAVVEIKCSLADSIVFNENRSVNTNTDWKPFVTYFNEHKILYIRMPEMSNKDFYIQQLDSIRERISVNEISKIIWDIRGNAGGDDGVWINVLFRLIDKPIVRKLTLCFNENNPYTYRFGEPDLKPFTNKFVSKGYQQFPSIADTMSLFEDSWRYKGKIYILQDEYCFSSAGSLISMCQFSDQLINAGNSTGWFAGFGTMPWVYILPHSKILYWVEPILDFTNVNKPEDSFHNDVKLKVVQNQNDYVSRYNNKGVLYKKDFLFNYDRLFLTVKDLK